MKSLFFSLLGLVIQKNKTKSFSGCHCRIMKKNTKNRSTGQHLANVSNHMWDCEETFIARKNLWPLKGWTNGRRRTEAFQEILTTFIYCRMESNFHKIFIETGNQARNIVILDRTHTPLLGIGPFLNREDRIRIHTAPLATIMLSPLTVMNSI